MARMDKAIKVLNILQKKGLITKYAIGGAIGAFFYAEPPSVIARPRPCRGCGDPIYLEHSGM
jgi:hypothetical protein